MRRLLASALVSLVAVMFWSCSDNDSGAGSTPTPSCSDCVAVNGLVWAVGTLGGLKAIDMTDTVVRAVNLGYDLYGLVTAYGRYVYLGDGMSPGVKRAELLSDTTDTVTSGTSSVTASLGRAVGMDAAAGRVWVIGKGSKTLFGIDTATNAMNLEISLGTDTGGCASMTPAGNVMYVVTRRPLLLHAVNLTNNTVTSSLQLEPGSDSAGNASVGFSGTEVYVYIADTKTLVVANPAATSEVRRVAVQGVSRLDERMCASSAGVFVTVRTGSSHSLLRVSAQTGAVEDQYDLTPSTEALTLAKVFGQRLLIVLIDSNFGQNAVVELDPAAMSATERVEHVYVSDISVERGR